MAYTPLRPPQPVRGEPLCYYYSIARAPGLGWSLGGYIAKASSESYAAALGSYNRSGLCVGVYATPLSWRLLRPEGA